MTLPQKSNRLPFMPVSTSNELVRVGHLNMQERGVYFSLQYLLWEYQGWIEDNDKLISKLLHTDVRIWRKVSKKLDYMLVRIEGKLTERNLINKFSETLQKHESNVMRGKKGGLKAAENKNTQQNNYGSTERSNEAKAIGDLLPPNLKHLYK